MADSSGVGPGKGERGSTGPGAAGTSTVRRGAVDPGAIVPGTGTGSGADALLSRARSGLLFYGLTPPRRSTPAERCSEIADRALSRLNGLAPDALVLYDVADETARTQAERPFPYLPMHDPVDFAAEHLNGWNGPLVLYRCVGKYTPQDLTSWMGTVDVDRVLTVFVGASSRRAEVRTDLRRAYELRQETRPDLSLGGVLIAERHAGHRDEHSRMLNKQERGCTFFISQICYDLNGTKNVLSDYAHTCAERRIEPRPMILTLAPCGSLQTLTFMKWLGIHVPAWLENDLGRAADPLAESVEHCRAVAQDLVRYCRRLELPFGINIESLTNRKVEIEASVALAQEIRQMLAGG